MTMRDANTIVGLVAGWGRYPIVIAESLRRQGHRIACVAVKDHAAPVLREICDEHVDLGLGQIGAAIRFFKRHGVRTAALAGKIHKVRFFQPYFLFKHFPDWTCARTFFPHFVSQTKDRKDDTLLRALVGAFVERGITFVPATEFLPELIVKSGVLTSRRPSRSELKDIELGWRAAKEIGRADIGQTIVVKGRVVIAVEAVEGTDRCIARAGELCPTGGFTVVKVAKPQQDMRFDVPTVGVGTLQSIIDGGGSVLAIEADKTILVDEPEVVALANQHRVTIVALQDAESARLADAA